MTISTFKSDKYRNTRGGYSRLLRISCAHCVAKVLLYQKDGSGPLKRLYLDRIVEPKEMTNFQHLSTSKMPDLVCLKCHTVLGIPYIYKKEKRKAYRLFASAVTKKIVKMK